jgi:ADP-glucose pyrophosphorylase
VLRRTQIGSGSHIRKTIIDENVRIPEGAIIGLDEKGDRRRFVVSKDGVVIVDNDSVACLHDERSKVILPRTWTA